MTVVDVVVVDDEQSILRLVQFLLASQDCRTYGFEDAEAALAHIKLSPPSLVLSDVRLPGMSGADLARRLKDTPEMRSMPVLLMSAFAEPDGEIADGFIEKPFDIDHLLAVLEPFLEKARKAVCAEGGAGKD